GSRRVVRPQPCRQRQTLPRGVVPFWISTSNPVIGADKNVHVPRECRLLLGGDRRVVNVEIGRAKRPLWCRGQHCTSEQEDDRTSGHSPSQQCKAGASAVRRPDLSGPAS